MKKYVSLLLIIGIVMTACRKDRNATNVAVNVKDFWPNSGNAGTIVTLQGQGLTKDVTVRFNGTEAKVVDARDSVMTVLAPATGTSGALSVQSGDRKQELGAYTYQALSLHRISPANGAAGTNVSIYGAGFSSLTAPAKVTVNGKDAIITGATDTLLVATVPEGAGTGKIAVTVDGKQVTGPDFIFQHISAIKPLKGGVGTEVTITGEGFNTGAGNEVTFNGAAAKVLNAAAGKLVVVAPEGVATGPVAVTINGQKTVGNVFTVVPKPLISTVAPLSAPAGIPVTISGNYFSTLTDEVTVSFNGIPAVVTSTSDKQISVKVPVGAGSGKMQVRVNGQLSDGPLFKEQALGITQLLPNNGLVGTEVIVKGIGFSTNATDNTVAFNGITVPVIAATDTTLRVIAPVGLNTGAVTVKVGTLDATGPQFSRAGVVTLAGGPSLNLFTFPTGIAVNSKGTVFVSDGNVIKKVAADGTVSIFVGRADGSAGNVNGTGTNAAFSYVASLVVDAKDNLYAIDQFNSQVRKITPAGDVTTFTKTAFTPTGIGMSKSGTIYLGAQYGGVKMVDGFGNITPLGGYESPGMAIAVNDAGTVFFAGGWDYPVIFSIAGGVKTTYAGTQFGTADGPLRSAAFSNPIGIVRDANTGLMYVADNYAIRMLTDDQVIRVAGWKGGTQLVTGFDDGPLSAATFSDITAICTDAAGNVYVAERGNKAVRKIFFK